MKTAAEMTVVHQLFLFPVADCVIFVVLMIKPLVLARALRVCVMGQNSFRFHMTTRILSRYLNHNDRVLSCIFCREPIELTQDTVSLKASRKQKHYHAECYEGTLH